MSKDSTPKDYREVISRIKNCVEYTIKNSLFWDYDDEKLKHIIIDNPGSVVEAAAKIQLMNRAAHQYLTDLEAWVKS